MSNNTIVMIIGKSLPVLTHLQCDPTWIDIIVRPYSHCGSSHAEISNAIYEVDDRALSFFVSMPPGEITEVLIEYSCHSWHMPSGMKRTQFINIIPAEAEQFFDSL